MPIRRRVLIVDDNPKILQAVSLRVRALGHDVITAEDGEKGLKQVATHHPDLVIADIRMPNMNGLEFLRRLRRNHDRRVAPVIMLSASAVDESKALDEGAFCFVAKPYDSQSLASVVGAALLASSSESGSSGPDPDNP